MSDQMVRVELYDTWELPYELALRCCREEGICDEDTIGGCLNDTGEACTLVWLRATEIDEAAVVRKDKEEARNAALARGVG